MTRAEYVGGALIFSQRDHPEADGRTRMSGWLDDWMDGWIQIESKKMDPTRRLSVFHLISLSQFHQQHHQMRMLQALFLFSLRCAEVH